MGRIRNYRERRSRTQIQSLLPSMRNRPSRSRPTPSRNRPLPLRRRSGLSGYGPLPPGGPEVTVHAPSRARSTRTRSGSCLSLASNGLAFTPPQPFTPGLRDKPPPLAFERAVGKGWTGERVAGADVAAVVDVGRERDRPRGHRRRAAGGGTEPGGGAGVRADRLRVLRGDAGRRAAPAAAGG